MEAHSQTVKQEQLGSIPPLGILFTAPIQFLKLCNFDIRCLKCLFKEYDSEQTISQWTTAHSILFSENIQTLRLLFWFCYDIPPNLISNCIEGIRMWVELGNWTRLPAILIR